MPDVRDTPYHVNFLAGFSGHNNPGGRTYYVGETAGVGGKSPSDSNSGLSPGAAFATIQKGLDSATASRGDVVAVLPGSYTITAVLTMTKADVKLVAAHPVPWGCEPNVTIACATDSISMLDIDASNVVVDGFRFDHNTTTANVPLIDISDTTAASGVVLRNLYIDMVGSATDTDGIRIGDGTQAVTNSLFENIVVKDYDQIGIEVAAGSDDNVFRNIVMWDDANTGTDGFDFTGDNCVLESCIVACGGTSCFSLKGTRNILNNCRADATQAAGTIGVLFADGASGQIFDLQVSAQDTGNFVDHTTDVDGNSGATGVASDSDGTICELLNPSIGGTP